MIDRLRAFLETRRHAYRMTFRGPLADPVLKDLARFCRAHESTAATDPRDAARLDGRREVWLRIEHHLRLSPDQLWELYTGHPKGGA